jgi:hypothetical protein
LGSDPGVTPEHAKDYLQGTELVPTYMATVPAQSTLVTSLASSYTPLQQGDFKYSGDAMASGGYAAPIGLLPQHDVTYLVSSGPAVYGAVVRNGYSAGRYAIHYRDEKTNRPLRFSSYPTLVASSGSGMTDAGASSANTYTPTPSGTSPPAWDGSHHPSVGYMAYLLTGRWYFMEEVQFACTANYINITDTYRGYANGVATDYRLQTRNAAWSARTLAQALSATPDSDPLRNDFIASMQATVDHFHNRYIAQKNNPFGLLYNEDYGGLAFWRSSVWQNDFAVGVFGYAKALDLPISAASKTKLDAFFNWLAGSVVGRLGAASDFWYVNGVPYTMAYSPSKSADFLGGTGPWFSDWKAIYTATYGAGGIYAGQPYVSSTEGVLGAEGMPGADSMWGNLQPAIAYAVRHGVSGASAAYTRMTSASNWQALADQFNSAPVWSVKPALSVTPPAVSSSSVPAWLTGAAIHQWVQIGGTTHAGSAADPTNDGRSTARLAFSNIAIVGNEVVIAATGGHGDYNGNEVTSINLAADAPQWRLRRAKTSNPTADAAYNAADGTPASRHAYWSAIYSTTRGRLMLHSTRFTWPTALSFNASNGFNLGNDTWDPAGTWSDGTAALCRDTSDNAWTVTGGYLRRWNASTDTWSAIAQVASPGFGGPMVHDSSRNQLFILTWGDGSNGGSGVNSYKFTPAGAQTAITFNASAAYSQFQAERPSYASMIYDAHNDRFLFWHGETSTLFSIKPNSGSTWDMSIVSTTGTLPPARAGAFGRMGYIAALNGCVFMPRGDTKHWFMNIA